MPLRRGPEAWEHPRDADEPGREGTRAKPLTVSRLNRIGREILEADLGEIFLMGEISNFKAHTSGHWYFSLKDDRAQIGAAMFRNANSRVRSRPADGIQVLVSGTVTLYEPRGQYQIVVDSLEPVGLGDLQAAFEKLKRKLMAEGLFEESRKRSLPPLPRRVRIPGRAGVEFIAHGGVEFAGMLAFSPSPAIDQYVSRPRTRTRAKRHPTDMA